MLLNADIDYELTSFTTNNLAVWDNCVASKQASKQAIICKQIVDISQKARMRSFLRARAFCVCMCLFFCLDAKEPKNQGRIQLIIENESLSILNFQFSIV